jgi:GTPase
MNLQIITVFTMIDLITKSELNDLIKSYKNLIKSLKISKIPLHVISEDDLVLFSRNIEEKIYPIITLSNKTGSGLDYLTKFLYLLSHKSLEKYEKYSEFDIQEHFTVDKKIIVGGIVSKGKIIVGDNFYLGPDKSGNFK